jgi:hypothetical protein
MIISVKKQYDPLTNTFSSYELIEENQLVKSVPLNEANRDYQAIQEWAKIEGNNIIDNGA